MKLLCQILVMFVLNLSLFGQNQTEEKIRSWQKLIPEQPNYVDSSTIAVIKDPSASKLNKALAHNIRANLFNSWEEFESASEEYFKALKLAEQSKNGDIKSQALNNLAILYNRLQQFQEASDFVNAALVLLPEDSIGRRIKCISILIVSQDALANKAIVDSLVFRAFNLSLQSEDDELKKIAALNLGNHHFRRGNLDSALAIFDSLENLLQGPMKFDLLYNKAWVYFDLKKFDGVVAMGNKMLISGLADSNKTSQALAHYMLAQGYEGSGNLEETIEHLYAMDEVETELEQEELADAIAEMQAKYDVESRERKIALQNAELQTQKWQRNALATGVGLVVLLSLFLFLYLRKRNQNQKLAAEKQKETDQRKIDELLNSQEKVAMNALIEGQEKERERIAKELHDHIGSLLSTVKMHFSALSDKIKGHEKQYNTATELLDQSVAEVRRISHNLVGGILMKFGLEQALKAVEVNINSSQSSMSLEVQCNNLKDRLNAKTELTLYRICQELISNALKHAKANEMTLQITRDGKQIMLIAEDNGQGFDPAVLKEGIGLSNIKSRVDSLNGVLNMDAAVGRGSTFIVEFNLETNV